MRGLKLRASFFRVQAECRRECQIRRSIAFYKELNCYRGRCMKAQGIPDFQAPPPIPQYIDTVEAIDELPSYDSFEASPDDF